MVLHWKLSREILEEIKTQYSTSSDQLRAVFQYVLTLHPQASKIDEVHFAHIRYTDGHAFLMGFTNDLHNVKSSSSSN